MGLKVFKKIKKRYDARVGVRLHIEALKKLNLLLESEGPESVKMHDFVRYFGISAASEGKFLVQLDSRLKEWPTEDPHEQWTHISVQCDELNEFMNGLKYSNLKFLQILSTESDFGYPESLDEGLEGDFHPKLELLPMLGSKPNTLRLDEAAGELQVLALQKISIPNSLLGSLERLKSLRTLSLSGCEMSVDISSIGNIEKLETLSFADSNISELPREIGKLCWLRLLDLSRCRFLRKIAPGVIKSLTRLEELKMAETSILRNEQITDDDHSDEEGEIKASDDDNHYACFAELKHLLELVVIEIEIPYGYLLHLNSANLMKFRIAIDNAMTNYYGPEEAYQNCLVLKCEEFFPLKGLLNALWKKTEFLFVEGNNLKILTNEVEEEDLISLRTLIFHQCDELVYVFAGINQGFNSCDSSFRNLTSLELNNCSELQSVCPVSTARHFTNLKRLNILYCSSIQEIFSTESAGSGHQDENDVVELLNLTEICLSVLPNLVSFCKSVDTKFNLPKLKKIELQLLPKLTSLYPEMSSLSCSNFPDGSSSENPFFHQKVTLNNMVELDILCMENLIELWHGQQPQLRSLELNQCNNLLRVFSSNTNVQQFECLELLMLHLCDLVEVIYDFRGMININDGNEIVALSTQLSFLSLSCLPKLTHVIMRGPHISYQGFQDLKEPNIISCHSLKSIFSLSIARGMSMLETVSVIGCDMMQAIFLEEDNEAIKTGDVSTIVFPNLLNLWLKQLPSLVGFCKSNLEVMFPQLKKIDLVDLPNLVGLNSGMETNVSGQTFEQKIKLNWSSLESLNVENCGFLEGGKTWTRILGESDVQQQVQCLANLRSLGIREAENLTTIFPENVHLELPSIKDICLLTLPKLESVWQENIPREIQYFQNLKALSVIDCTCLRTLFTPYVAKNLTRLKTLSVDGCDSMVELVAEQENNEVISTEKQVLFPKLEWLALRNLPNLLIVLPKRYSFNWSYLKDINVDEELIHLLKRPEKA